MDTGRMHMPVSKHSGRYGWRSGNPEAIRQAVREFDEKNAGDPAVRYAALTPAQRTRVRRAIAAGVDRETALDREENR